MSETETSAAPALVLFSGGQDSTVCLAWALERYRHVETVGYSYGQRHAVELEARVAVRDALIATFPAWSKTLGCDHMVDLSVLGEISDTALTRDVEIELSASGLPTSFVPGRNVMFFTLAAALGYRRGITTLVGGMCETDFSGYPDCRDATLRSLETSISLGMDRPFKIETPLMFIDKAATWQMAMELGGDTLVDIIIEDSHTCYIGKRTRRHAWGYGCGRCPACVLRKKGFETWQSSTISAKS